MILKIAPIKSLFNYSSLLILHTYYGGYMKGKNKLTNKKNNKELSYNIKFLRETKSGKYAEIADSSLEYVRIASEVQEYCQEDEYIYSTT